MYQSTESTVPLASSKGASREKAAKQHRSPKIPKASLEPSAYKPTLQAISAEQFPDEESKEWQPLIPQLRENLKQARQNNAALMSCSCILVYLAAFLAVAAFCYGIIVFSQSFSCLGAPYLYITHKGRNNIMKYSRDGCLIHEKVLWGISNQRADLRAMAYGPYNGEEALFVADSSANQSDIMVFGSCFQSTSLRPFVTRVRSANHDPGAVHAYGVVLDKEGNLFVSYQDTSVILRFRAHSFEPWTVQNISALLLDKNKGGNSSLHMTGDAAHPSGAQDPSEPLSAVPTAAPTKHGHLQRRLDDGSHNKTKKSAHNQAPVDPSSFQYYDGTFVQFGVPGALVNGSTGVRSIAWVRNYTELWIAHEALDSVVIVDREGRLLGTIQAVNPIGLHYPPGLEPSLGNFTDAPGMDSPFEDVVYVSCKANKRQSGVVLAVDASSRRILQTYHSLGMKHPAGVTSYRDTLFVADQTRNAIIAFNITTARVVKVIAPKRFSGGAVEQVTLSPC